MADQMNADLLRSIADEMEQQPLDDLTDAERADQYKRWFERLVAEGYDFHSGQIHLRLENNELRRRIRGLEAELIELRQAEIARHEANAASKPDAQFADQMSELFSWLARFAVRYQGELNASGISNQFEVMAAELEGQEPPDPVPVPPREHRASSAFVSVMLSETPPQWLFDVLPDCSLPVRKQRSEVHSRLRDSRPVRFQDVPGAVEALRSVVQSSNFPLIVGEGEAS